MKHAISLAATLALVGVFGTAQAADASAGKTKAASCAGCHGAKGEGSGQNPALAGMPAAKFIAAMKDYKSGKRANAVMKNFAAPLSDDDIANMAAHYASLKK